MSFQQSAFLFDYQAFRKSAEQLMAALEAGDPGPLRERVSQIRQDVGAHKNWILYDKGTAIWDFVSPTDPECQNALWGHWFMIALSTFLHPCVSLGYDWHRLAGTLHYLGWSDEERELVYIGFPIAHLLKPDARYPNGLNATLSHPYWYWVRPFQTPYSGWLPLDKIAQLQERLLADQPLLTKKIQGRAPLSLLPPHVSTKKAHISRELDPHYWYSRVPIVYQQSIEMMSQALEAKVGLFMVVYQEEGEQEGGEDEYQAQ